MASRRRSSVVSMNHSSAVMSFFDEGSIGCFTGSFFDFQEQHFQLDDPRLL